MILVGRETTIIGHEPRQGFRVEEAIAKYVTVIASERNVLSEPDIETIPSDHENLSSVRLRTVIAIPVCNEAERIGACLAAIGSQAGHGTNSLGILLFLNNCTDDTAAVVPDLRRRLTSPMRVIERDMAGAHAGWARREAMEAAARWLDETGAPDGVILTTDADSRVPTDWVARNLATIESGADAVAGRIALDPDEAARLPDALHARGRLEGAYEALLTELATTIDPRPDDPWPCHWTASGATLGVRLSTYRQVGGMPAVPVGEDRAFMDRLLAADARVRHAPDIVVITSGRLEGRAPGGAADTMKLRCEAPESPCDPRLEALSVALLRYVSRRRLRALWSEGRLGTAKLWAPLLGIGREEARAIARLATAGQVLAAVEQASPRLAYRPLKPRELPSQIRSARAVLRLVRFAGRARHVVAGGVEGRLRPAMASLLAERRSRAMPVIAKRVEAVGPDTTS